MECVAVGLETFGWLQGEDFEYNSFLFKRTSVCAPWHILTQGPRTNSDKNTGKNISPCMRPKTITRKTVLKNVTIMYALTLDSTTTPMMVLMAP